MDFNNRLKKLRKEKNMNQSDLAKILGVGRTTVTCWERGDNFPSVEVLDKLASFLNVSTDELLGRPPAIDKFKRDDQNVRLLAQYSKLNDFGKKEAVKRVSELCMIPKYIDKDIPIAAHSDKPIDDNELKLMHQDIDEL